MTIPDAALPVLDEALEVADADAVFVAGHLEAAGWAIVPARVEPVAPPFPLRPRQLELLALLPKPLTYRQIASLLRESEGAVRQRAQTLFARFGVNDRLGVVLRAVVLGFLSEDAVFGPYRVPSAVAGAVR